ncbi:MAG: ACT domain-containing protein [Sulfolobus sp.]|nr:ACT domain-containing protein [Sulfolobus sp.]
MRIPLNGDRVPLPTISDIFKVVDDSGHIGIVPVENSIEGPVGETLDNLFRYDNIFVNYEVIMKVNLVLASKSMNPKKIYSHPHAIQEARGFLLQRGFKNIIPVESTSKAAELASNDPEAGAICSRYAAQLYGLVVIDDNIQDDPENYTRFLVISKKKYFKGDKSMIFFTVEDKPGALYRVLEVFYKYNINITMIYSRPIRTLPWHYYFFLEYNGDVSDDKLFEDLKKVTKDLKIKGSYVTLQNSF